MSDVKKAAEEFFDNHWKHYDDVCSKAGVELFEAGAAWQREQIISTFKSKVTPPTYDAHTTYNLTIEMLIKELSCDDSKEKP